MLIAFIISCVLFVISLVLLWLDYWALRIDTEPWDVIMYLVSLCGIFIFGTGAFY